MNSKPRDRFSPADPRNSRIILAYAEDAMRGSPVNVAAVYDRVAGKAVDQNYEAMRRPATLSLMCRSMRPAVARLIWC